MLKKTAFFPGKRFLLHPSLSGLMMPVFNIHIGAVRTDGLVSRADDLPVIGQLFHAVGAPAGDARHGKNGGVKLHGKAQHMINKAGVEVHINADTLVHLPFAGDNFRRKPLNQRVQRKFFSRPFSTESFSTKVLKMTARGSDFE